MKLNQNSKAEFFANIAIIIVSLLVSVVLIKQYFFTPSLKDNSSSNSANYLRYPSGKKLNLENVDWSGNGQTAVLILSSSCEYCTKSAHFYQKLGQDYNVKRIAVFAEDSDQAQQYLNRIGVQVDDVKHASLDSLEAVGTPIILLVNKSGIVTDSWVGILSPERETEVFNRLQVLRIAR